MDSEVLRLYKLMILYFLDIVEFPLTNAQISAFLLDNDYTGYFNVQLAFSELEESALIEKDVVRNATYLRISDEGRKTLELFYDQIPQSIRDDIKAYLLSHSHRFRNEVSTPAVYTFEKGNYLVDAKLLERESTLLEIKIAAPTEKRAAEICDEWQAKSEAIYSLLFEQMVKPIPESEPKVRRRRSSSQKKKEE